MLYKTKRIVKLGKSQAAKRSAAFYRTRRGAERERCAVILRRKLAHASSPS
jgi:hypothetical protein